MPKGAVQNSPTHKTRAAAGGPKLSRQIRQTLLYLRLAHQSLNVTIAMLEAGK